MSLRFALLTTSLLVVCTGCPDTWGIEGTMDQAMAKDIQEMTRQKNCALEKDDYEYRCGNVALWKTRHCPTECR
ncbi:MAG TPA: hypothetical protein VF794_40660 [Archangium sp.]|jgi:hypothetical protein|uniref:hypothetical protein n=1 Tax=Archangium sp. TaxID=1872627 RepID=UPI002ED84AB4